jgi:hypothetical protein
MYITPRVLIQQEFTQLPVYTEYPLPAFIIGPNYNLNRYGIAEEKTNTVLKTLNGEILEAGNAYNPLEDTVYDIPNLGVGNTADHTYTKVFAENVEAKYFPLDALNSVGNNEVVFVENSGGAKYTNKVRFTDVVLKNFNGYTRAVDFSNRDVAVGDVIKITDDLGNVTKAKITSLIAEGADVNSPLESVVAPQVASGSSGVTNGTNTFTDSSASFVASQVVGKYITIQGIANSVGTFKILDCPSSTSLTLSSTVASYTNRSWYISGVYKSLSNAATQTEDFNNSVTGTSNTTVTVANVSSAYKGYNSKRVLADTYTVTVTTGGDLDEVKFSIASENGVFALKTNVSLDEGVLTIDSENNNSVELEFSQAGVPAVNFNVGDTWSLSVTAPVSSVVPVASGSYTGKVDMVYTLRVERGGPLYDGTNSSVCARVAISSSNLDANSVVLPIEEEPFALGSFGAFASFDSSSNNGGLILGDVYYIPVSAEKKGPVTIVEFSEALTEATLNLASSLTAELCLVQKNIEINQIKDLVEDTKNWTQEDSYITINAGITTYNPSLVTGNEIVRLPIQEARLFVENRGLKSSPTVAIDSVRALSEVQAKLGKVHPDNPLAQGVYEAILNAQNQLVYFIGVNSDSLEGYLTALGVAEKSDKVYSFVPLTFNKTIQDAVVSHVNAYSTATAARWRIAWLAIKDEKSVALYDTKEDDTDFTATITDDTTVSGTQYRLLTVEGADFLDSGVRPGDSVRINFKLTADGGVAYDEYFVQQVRTNTTLTLSKPSSTSIDTATKVQILRTFTKSERAENIAAVASGYNNRRVRCVFPDTYKYAGITKEGYFAAAGLAGLRSGVVPHQGLTNTEYLGADDLSKSVVEFSQEDLDTMAESGVWILTQETVSAQSTAYVRLLQNL